MELTFEEFKLAASIAEETIKIDSNMIDNYINESVKDFTDKLDKSKLEDRKKIFAFLQHISTLLLNYDINGGLYLLGEKEQQKSMVGRKAIVSIVKEFRESGL